MMQANKKHNFDGTLPANTNDAINIISTLTEGLLTLAERETQALVQNDLIQFAVLQHEKDIVADQYNSACQQFSNRLEEFRSTDRSVLDTLERLQIELGNKVKSNNKIVARMRDDAKEKTSTSLLTVQELAQSHPVNINEQAYGTKK